MTTYRSRAAVCEAMQWGGGGPRDYADSPQIRAEQIVAWVNANGGEARYEYCTSPKHSHGPSHCIAVRTISGWAYADADAGQYIVKGTATFTVLNNIGGQDIEKELRNFYPRDPVTFETLWSADPHYSPRFAPADESVLNALRHETQELRQALVTSESKVEHLSVVLDDERKRRIHDIQRVRRLTDLLLRQPAHGRVNSNDSDTEDVHDDF